MSLTNTLLASGETGRLIASRDWAATPLGPLTDWPQSLLTTVGLVLRSPVPMVLLWGEDGVMLYNDAYSAFAGGRHPELLGSKVREGWPEVADFNDHVMRVGLSGGTLSYRGQELTLHRHGQPEQVFMDLDYAPVPDESGRPGGVLAIVVETTERVLAERRREAAEAALRASEQELRNTVELNPQVPWTCDPQGRITSYSKRWLDLTGQAPGEPLGEGWARVVHPDDQPAAIASFSASLASGKPVDVEYRIRVATTGEHRWMRARANPLRDEAGAILRWYGLVEDIHDRKLAEMRLRASHERFAGAVAAVDGVLWTNDAAGRMSGDQPGWAALTGQSPHAYQGYGWTAAIHPDDAEPTLEAWTAAVRERRPFVFQHRVRRRDGAWRLFSVRAIPVTEADGTVREWVGVHADITEQERARAELAEETHALEAINRAGAALAGELDLERAVQTVTDAGVAITGAGFGAFFYNVLNERGESLMLYTLSGAERSSFDRFGMPRATSVFRPTFKGESVIRSNDILVDPRYGLNTPHRGMPEGHLPVRSYLAVPVTSRSGEVIGGLFFGHPEPGRFSERHERLMIGLAGQAAVAIDNARLFQAVQRANATLEAQVAERTAERDRIWQLSPDLMCVAKTDGTLVSVNPAWERLLGWPLDWLTGRKAAEIKHPDDAERTAAELARLAAGNHHSLNFEDRYRTADGAWRWISWVIEPEGQLIYCIGRDVTAEKAAAAELQQAQDALRQAQKMEAVGQLTGGIAHDFNNLLGAVVGSFDLIRRKPTDVERVRRFAEAGLAAAERGAKLTGQLLAFSRAQRLELKPLIVADLVDGMRDLLARTLGPMIRLHVALDERRWPVLSDPTQLEMAVLNLCINARDAMPDGGDLTLRTALRQVGADPELEPGAYVELAVTDTGSGMSPEVLERAFDPFFTTKGIGKGTGLGLSQVYGIARQAGGAVRLESREGHGTTVRILLPRTDAALHPDQAGGGLGQSEVGASATILIVDDDPDIRRVLADSLDALGYRVVEAADGPAGLAALDAESPDLMMVDFAMPGMNGAEVARAARQRRPSLPIVFASGYADTAAIESAAGPDTPVLRKPFRIHDLQAVVAQMLAARP
ncbi:MAG TPA: PAS domain S-box protein [Beijerinckiaceae bacterium]